MNLRNRARRQRRTTPKAAQRGISTILILLLVGLAVSVTVLIVAYSLRSTQQRQLATHAATTAQATAWRGVEIVRAAMDDEVMRDQLDALASGQGWGTGGSVITVGGSGGQAGAGGGATGGTSGGGGSQSGGGSWTPGQGYTGGQLDIGGLPDEIDAFLTSVVRLDQPDTYEVMAQVVGRAAGGVDGPLATSTLQVVYELRPVSSYDTSEPPVCASVPPALMVFNGDLNITGGSLGVTGDPGDEYENIAVSGNLTVGSSSSARISGCAKGDITLSGGGITENGHLHAEGAISVTSMTPPNGTTFWGRQITLDGSSSGARYAALKAGAYTASVMVGDAVVGTTRVGGSLLPGTAGGGIPWTTGIVVPGTGTATFVVTLTDGSQFVLDPADLTIDASTGAITGATAAAERIEGQGEMPGGFTLRSGSIFGGGIGAQGLATTGLVWGHALSLGLSPYGGLTGGIDVDQLRANGNLEIGTGAIRTLVGGGSLWAKGAGRSSPTNHWNFPRVGGSGRIAGQVHYGNEHALLPLGEAPTAIGTQAGQQGASPGLPGIPYCDARVKAIDAQVYKSQANYIFEMVAGVPTLTIRNVKNAAGGSIDGTYNLATGDLRRMPRDTGAPFLTCNWQTDADNADAHCFRTTTAESGWRVTGLSNFPKGVVWFDGPFTVDGTQNGQDLVNTIVGVGKVTLTQSGHGDLVAPNFSTPERLCGGAFWPANLCDKSGGRTAFATWTDAEGEEHVGLPIGNVAIATEGAGALAGWNIYGSVMLGRNLETAANVTVVQGTLTVGANQSNSTTLIDQGGARIRVPGTKDQILVPTCEAPPPTGATEQNAMRVRWSRYL